MKKLMNFQVKYRKAFNKNTILSHLHFFRMAVMPPKTGFLKALSGNYLAATCTKVGIGDPLRIASLTYGKRAIPIVWI
jgi:hypothetical protein